ncbi:MAG TPA: hypothetical protein VER12_04545 [Polyangiaceae bacterium]|nr:hypothetical protein [Polyangiaceae bacterium]
MVGLSLAACGTEDDAAPGPSGGTGANAGEGANGGAAANGGSGAVGGMAAEGGMAGSEPGPGPGPGPGGAGGSGGDGASGEGGDGPGSGGDGNLAGAGGEGGQAPLACHTDLFNFTTDPAGSMGKYLTPDTGPVQSSTVEWSSLEGAAAPGAGKLNATFGAAGEQAQLSLYLPKTTWTCTTKLHAKIKIQSATDLSAINGVSLSINSGPYDSTGRYSSQFTSTSSFVPDTWYAIELPFATAGYQSPVNTLPDFTDVRSVGVMLQTKATGTTPTPVTLYVDDVWVE